jgi:4-hydroxyphenylpyruvate dioxygenase
MRRSIATVCLSGGLAEKMHAASAAGFDGIEIFEPDLIASEMSPEEIRALADRLGLSLDLYQPFRDFEGVDDELLEANLRRAEAKFKLMQRLRIDTILVCSNVATATVDSIEVSAAQLRRLGDLAQRYDVKVAFEALAWGRYVDDYRLSWEIVEKADHPNVGLCLDSFHILSRGHDPAAIEQIPGEKIFFLQLADAPALSMDVLSWSRHHRLFPGEGAFDLPTFVAHVLRAGYTGPLSLEVFNDTFRQTDPERTAVHALRSLIGLEDKARALAGSDEPRLPSAGTPTGVDFVEVKAEDVGALEVLLDQLGFSFAGRHRTKPVTLWASGEARVILNQQGAREVHPTLSAVGLRVPDVELAAARADALLATRVRRRTYRGEVPLVAFEAPDGTEIFLSDAATERWREEFGDGEEERSGSITHVDHINLAQPWEDFDEAVLFYAGVLELAAAGGTEVAGPNGLVRSQVMASPDGAIRLPLNVAPASQSGRPQAQHVAFACTDARGLLRAARTRGLSALAVPANYYDDLQARFGLDPVFVEELRELGLMYDRDEQGEYLNAYTGTVGDVFLEIVQRGEGYTGFGASNAPVRMASQRR